jgi:hypothetical protein
MNELLGKISEQLEQGWSVHGVHKCASLTSGQFMRKDLGTREMCLENVSKAGKPPMGPHEAIQKLTFDV